MGALNKLQLFIQKMSLKINYIKVYVDKIYMKLKLTLKKNTSEILNMTNEKKF